ncbi:MAG: hypothetical protein QXK65_01930 [Candidatus Micrarchaeaceae archaeon]
MYGLQFAVVASTASITVLSLILAISLTLNFRMKRQASYLFWSLGMWIFALGVALELVFAFGVYNKLLADAYLFAVALTVELLALGSMQLIRSAKARLAYYAYCIATSVLLAVLLYTSKFGNIIVTYVVFGALPLPVVIASSLIAFPAAVLLAVIAAMSYRRTRSSKMLSIIAGVVVVSVAGTLYIAAFPEFLYFAEFAGILLLWLGFFDIKTFREALRSYSKF